MSGRRIDTIISQALRMPEKERALMAERMISSLDAEVHEVAETAWRAEVQRRIQEIESDRVKCMPWEEVRRRLTEKSHAKR